MAERAFNIVVSVDTTQADKQLSDFEREVQNTQRELQGLGGRQATTGLQRFGDAANDATRDMRELTNQSDQLGTNLGALGGAVGTIDGEVAGLGGNLLELAQTMAIMRNSTDTVTTALTRAQLAFDNANDHANGMEDALANGTITLEQYNAQVGETADELEYTRVQLAAATASMEEQNTTANRLKRALTGTTAKVVAIGAAAVIAAGQMAKMTVQMSAIAGLDIAEFQSFSFATKQFGLDAQGTADILKDFNDKIGDFIVTGGGPLVDVFERLGKETGLTAQKLVSLSGPDALVALVSSMEKANISSQEQVFILESMGSNLTMLLPLLKNNAEALREIEDATVGMQSSETAILALNDVSTEFTKTIEYLKGLFLELTAIFAPLVEVLLMGFNKIIGGITKGVKLVSAGILITAANLEELFGNDDIAEGLRSQLDGIFASIDGIGKVAKDTSADVAALLSLQDKRANKVSVAQQKEIDNQLALLSAVGRSTDEYEQLLFVQTRLAKVEAKRIELTKLGLRPEQIQKLVDEYDLLLISAASVNTEFSRKGGIENFNDQLKDQYQLLLARNEEEERYFQFRQQLAALNATENEVATAERIQGQIIAQEKLNALIEEQRQAYYDLGDAVRSWALGSEEAIIGVITQLLRLAALNFGGASNPFVQGFLGGMQGFANGGTFNAGETFMVGEKGPEIITSRAGGTVIPNHKLGGSGLTQNLSLSINGSIVASEELDAKFEEFAGAVATSTQRLMHNQFRTGGIGR